MCITERLGLNKAVDNHSNCYPTLNMLIPKRKNNPETTGFYGAIKTDWGGGGAELIYCNQMKLSEGFLSVVC